MKKNFIGIAILFAAGCAEPEQTATIGPSGQRMFLAKCNQSPTGCYQEAAKSCAGPYQVLDSYSKAGGLAADIFPGPVTWYYMNYECGKSDGRTPTFPFRGQAYVPPPVSKPTTTNCSAYGDTLRCRTY